MPGSSKRKKDRSGTPACSAHIHSSQHLVLRRSQHTHISVMSWFLVIVGISRVIKSFFFLHIHYQKAKDKARFHKEWNRQALMSKEK